MDISSVTTLELQTPRQSSQQVINPVNIDELGLVAEKTYPAKVLGPALEILNLTEQSKQQLAEQKALINLLRISGQVIATQSEETLVKGQTIQVRLTQEGSLAITQPELAKTTQTANLLAELKTDLFAKQLNLLASSAHLKALTNALNQTLTQQASLNLGIETLAKAQSNGETGNVAAKQILSILASVAPKKNDLLTLQTTIPTTPQPTQAQSSTSSPNSNTGITAEPKSNTGQIPASTRELLSTLAQQIEASLAKPNNKPADAVAPTSDQKTVAPLVNRDPITSLVKEWVQLSGVNWENRMMNSPELRMALNQHLQNIRQIAASTTDNTNQTQLPKGAQATNSNTAPLAVKGEERAFSQALSYINNAVQASKENNTPTLDIKSTMQLITQAAASAPTNEGSKTEGFLQVDLLKFPFNFPPPATNIAQAASILADQDLSTGQLLKLVAGMLNRIHFNQLNGLMQTQNSVAEGNPTQSWFVEIPISTGPGMFSFFNLRLEREQRNSATESKNETKKELTWKILLSFNLEPLGPIFIQANLLPPSISSIFWAEKAETLQLLNKETAYFRQQLTDLGLDVGDIRCQRGQPKQIKTAVEQHLVDTKV